jgi:hypothetical protein
MTNLFAALMIAIMLGFAINLLERIAVALEKLAALSPSPTSAKTDER